jgi:hypothetical protein
LRAGGSNPEIGDNLRHMRTALRLGFAYFAAVFAAGFALGVVRTVWIAPALGEVGAVLLELPVMIAISAAVCRALLARASGGVSPSQAWAMGVSAFLMLIAAEAATAVGFSGTAPQALPAAFARPEALLGLAGQVVFALIPRLTLGLRRPPR